jgi:hypothetical protein
MWSKRIKTISWVLYKIVLGWVKYNWNVGTGNDRFPVECTLQLSLMLPILANKEERPGTFYGIKRFHSTPNPKV